jgi:Zn-dependent protease
MGCPMGWQYQPYEKRGLRFSRLEIRDILLAVSALILGFSIAFTGGIAGLGSPRWLPNFLFFLAVAVIAVPTGFLLHELMHKAVAQRFGCWAEFRTFRTGLFLALLTSTLGFIFAAPGAVVISGMVTKPQNGRISLAGPGTNLVLTVAFMGLWAAVPASAPFMSGGKFQPPWTYGDLISQVARMNLFLAGFNLLPIPPLDGSKVAQWNIPTYLATWGAVAGLAYLLFFRAPLF